MDKGLIGYLLLSAVVCGGMILYCNNCNVQESAAKETVTETKTEPTTSQIVGHNENSQNEPAYVEYVFLDDFGIPHAVVKNNGEQIYGYGLRIKYYNENKEEIFTEESDIDEVVPAGMSGGLERFIPKHEGTKYIDAAITYIKLLDNKKELEPIFKNDFISLRNIPSGRSGAECKFIDISPASVISSQGESDLSDIRFSVKNKSERTIKNIEFLAAEFDAQGSPVSALPNGYICSNVRKLSWDNASIKQNEEKTAASPMALNKDCASVKLIVNHVEFEDRGVWSNPDTLDWIIQQGGSEK